MESSLDMDRHVDHIPSRDLEMGVDVVHITSAERESRFRGGLFYYYCYYNNIDAIIHLAAECGGIGINQRKPADFFFE